MVRKLFTSTHITQDAAKECFNKLKELDDSDMTGRTLIYCNAAAPTLEAKRETYERIFTSVDDGKTPLGLQECQEMCMGFYQISQKEIIETFADEFFERIEGLVEKAAWSCTRYVYAKLQPKIRANAVERERFERMLQKI